MIKVGVVGATGYTGMELLKILFDHPEVEVVLATSERYAGKKISSLFPYFERKTELSFEALNDSKISKACLYLFSCLPHQSAMTHTPYWLKKGTKVIDLSADFRLRSPAVYKEWYEKHTSPDLLKEAVYGLPEIHREEIKKAFLVGNPGCYPTGAILGLAPLIRHQMIALDRIVIDAKSGVTGAGRNPTQDFLFSEVNESVHAYKVGHHRHTPEIEQELSLLAGEKMTVSFAPHLVPIDRGILSTIYARSLRKITTKSVRDLFANFYKGEPFVQVLPEGALPRTKEVRGTNNCLIGLLFDPRTDQIVVVTAIDNLGKGAASQAVQNMNLMQGFPEETGLRHPAWVP